jgi:hypothetical protein
VHLSLLLTHLPEEATDAADFAARVQEISPPGATVMPRSLLALPGMETTLLELECDVQTDAFYVRLKGWPVDVALAKVEARATSRLSVDASTPATSPRMDDANPSLRRRA